MSARTDPSEPSTDPCKVSPAGGYRSIENQLYRVQTFRPGALGTATFVWSRENASIVVFVPTAARSGNDLTVDTVGQDKALAFEVGDWVELTDDTHELHGRPGTLVKLSGSDGGVLTVDPTTAIRYDANSNLITPKDVDWNEFPDGVKVRRWDGEGDTTVQRPNPAGGDWLSLEDGVQVRFENGSDYRTGQYWTIPARTRSNDVEWPNDAASGPVPLPPEGVVHHYCALALVKLENGRLTVTSDCRLLFPPLTDIHATDVKFDNRICDFSPDVVNVQQAIDALCRRHEEGCAVAIRPEKGWERAFAKLRPGQDGNFCFQPGVYVLREPITLADKGHVKISGAGKGTRIIASRSEAAFLFERCKSVIVRDLHAETGVAGSGGASSYLNGTVTARDCRSVTLEALDLVCASAVVRSAACISVESVVTVKPRNAAPPPPAPPVPREAAAAAVARKARAKHAQGRAKATAVQATRVAQPAQPAPAPPPPAEAPSAQPAVPAPPAAAAAAPPAPAAAPAAAGAARPPVGERVEVNPYFSQSIRYVGDDRHPRDVTIRDCHLSVGHLQVGILVVNAQRAVIEGNVVHSHDRPPGMSIGKLIENRTYRSHFRRLLMSDYSARKRNLDKAMKAGLQDHSRYVVDIGGKRAVSFLTDRTLIAAWKVALGKSPVPEGSDPEAARKHLRRLADQMLLTGRNSKTNPALAQWFAGLILPPSVSQGIVVGGTHDGDVRIAGNTIHGVLQGIHVGASARLPRKTGPEPRGPDTPASVTGRVRIQGNTIQVTLPADTKGERHGIFIGNFDSAIVEDNFLTLSNYARTHRNPIDAIRVYGYLGRMLFVRANHVASPFTVGIRVASPVFYAQASGPSSGRWRVTDNVAYEATHPVLVSPANLPVRQADNT